jgi:hypothetical protein
MTASYLPMILTEGLLVDGEAAQLLAIHNSTPAPVAKATGVVASPNRNGKMKIALLLQWDGGADTNLGTLAPNGDLTIVVRSPYPGDKGGQQNRPVVKLTNAAGPGGLIAKPVSIPGNPPALVAADYLPTFNGKPIPNWTVVVSATAPSEDATAVYIEIDFGHTISN